MFDENFVDVFIQIMPAYARGTVVELTDGRKTIVTKNYKGHIYEPDVRILDTKEVIKLSTNHDLNIKCAIS